MYGQLDDRQHINRRRKRKTKKGNFHKDLPQCEVGAQTRSLQYLQVIEESLCVGGRVEGNREKTPITPVGRAEAVIEWP